MEILVDRFISDDDSTISRIMVGGKFICFGLEDEFRIEKVPGETRIPAGKYKISLRKEGGHHKRYTKRFPDIHQGMLHIQNVPNFTYILIHCGNTDEDTKGCLLVGSQAHTEPGDMKIISSSVAYRRFYPAAARAAKLGELSIVFQDNDQV